MKNTIALLAFIIAMGIALVACGSTSSDIPSLRATDTQKMTTPTSSTKDSGLDDEAKLMAFTQCMRDQGIPLLDPVVDSEGNLQKPKFAEDYEIDKDKYTSANEVCGELIEGVSFGGRSTDITYIVDQYVAIATCLREKGYDIDDPTEATLDTWLGEFTVKYESLSPNDARVYAECLGASFGQGNSFK